MQPKKEKVEKKKETKPAKEQKPKEEKKAAPEAAAAAAEPVEEAPKPKDPFASFPKRYVVLIQMLCPLLARFCFSENF